MHKHSSQNSLRKWSKVALDIPNEVKDVDKTEEEADLKEKTETTSKGQPVNQINQIGRSIPLIVAIQDPGLTK